MKAARAWLVALSIGLLIMLSGTTDETLAAPEPPDGSTPSPPATTAPERTNVTVLMNGDLLWHNTNERPKTALTRWYAR
ncbi:MAG TPA: hypothetical protein VK390_05275 [Propionibacteriaceae bacterium]|nr:hypothetical protein [Propionibacteriaceae bacterium]